MPNPSLSKAEIERRRKAVEFREENEARFKRGGRLKMLLERRSVVAARRRARQKANMPDGKSARGRAAAGRPLAPDGGGDGQKTNDAAAGRGRALGADEEGGEE